MIALNRLLSQKKAETLLRSQRSKTVDEASIKYTSLILTIVATIRKKLVEWDSNQEGRSSFPAAIVTLVFMHDPRQEKKKIEKRIISQRGCKTVTGKSKTTQYFLLEEGVKV